MGCTQSKIENEETVNRCKERRQFMERAVTARNKFAAAHSMSLKNTGAALSDYAHGEVAYPSSSSATAASASVATFACVGGATPPPPLPPYENFPPPLPPLPASFTTSLAEFEEDSTEREEIERKMLEERAMRREVVKRVRQGVPAEGKKKNTGSSVSLVQIFFQLDECFLGAKRKENSRGGG